MYCSSPPANDVSLRPRFTAAAFGNFQMRDESVKILGLDCGQTGAAAKVEVHNGVAPVLVGLIDIPMLGTGAKERVDVIELAKWISANKPDHALVERGQAMPRQGASSGFKFGRTCGSLEAAVVLSGVPWSLVEASAWKKFYRLGRDKEQARQRAIQLIPGAHDLLARKRDHNRAEAILIALYGAHVCHL
jgi:crossover junction endodeoxyribonuclease RuvC